MSSTIQFPTEPKRVEDVKIVMFGNVPVELRWQLWHDHWRNTDRNLRWYDKCVCCRRNVWAFDDGENDPRGVLGNNALWTSDFEVEGQDEPVQVRTCAVCANEDERYLHAEKLLKERGAEAVAPLVWPGAHS